MENQRTVELTGADGARFEITTLKFEPVTAYRLLAKIGRVLIPAGLMAKDVGLKSATADLMPAVRTLFDSLTPELAEQVMLESLAASSCVRPDEQGTLERIDLNSIAKINRAFRGNLKMMLMAIKHSLEVNYGDFFDGSAGAASMTPTPSP